MAETMFKPGVKLAVFSIRKLASGAIKWVRAGDAFVNRDGSLNIELDVLPLDGRIHVREAAPAKTETEVSDG